MVALVQEVGYYFITIFVNIRQITVIEQHEKTTVTVLWYHVRSLWSNNLLIGINTSINILMVYCQQINSDKLKTVFAI